MVSIHLFQHEWVLDEYLPDDPAESTLTLPEVTAALNTALNLAIDFEERMFIDKVTDRYSPYMRNPSDVKNIVNAIWVAYFGEVAYDGYITPSEVLKWGTRVGMKPLLPLDVTVQPLLEWAEKQDCPDDIVTPVKRSLEIHERT
tara:strand:- start:792 stop:1223 length:432 start_codon:yes stop_codon:yes gene_type:complete